MEKMGLNEIREKFLSFFESKGCLRLGSFPLVPRNDASLLLINSGMAPMKRWFTGAETPPRKRVTTCQKCIRTPDIERVGKTARHGTFFEMLGNFSFGDYFKESAIPWAWEFLTETMGLPADRLWITIYEDDDEAFDIWAHTVGVPEERIVRMGKEDNFWEHGTGPCGPCSEIHYDRGEEFSCGPDCHLGCDCDRFMEVWNLVFTQFDRDEDGNYTKLPKPNIDTGMGLERLACVMQGVSNLFEVDTVQGVMKHISSIAGVTYKQDEKTDVSLRVITDHIRSTVMMVSDGVIPSNEGRGYVLRRLLRRAARHGKLLGIDHPFLYEVVDTVVDTCRMGYPELEEKREYIKRIVKIEEERFDATIDNGLVVLNQYIADAKAEGRDTLSGAEAFKLHDTYGFPLDLTVEIAGEENGLAVDVEGFNSCMRDQKEAARAARKDGSSWDAEEEYSFEGVKATEFSGYDTLCDESEIEAIAAEGEVAAVIAEGETGVIVAGKTPFYAEMGGQVGDIGKILSDGAAAVVTDTQKSSAGLYMHTVKVTNGEFKIGDRVRLEVDKKNRMAVERNHSATHLLHRALRNVLGTHVAQAGSFVSADRLRFDFSHFEAMTKEQLSAVENEVNEAIMADMPIETKVLPIDEAKKLGAEAQFGEKYGDVVRVVCMGDYSMEFCGGTHLKTTAQAGLIKILSEGGVAAGIRRIEAVTGSGVMEYIKSMDALTERTAAALRTNQLHEIDKKAQAVMAESRDLSKEIDRLKEKINAAKAKDMKNAARAVGGVNLLTARMDGSSADDMKKFTDSMKPQIENAVIIAAADNGGKVTFIAAASAEAVKKGVHCGKIIKEITAVANGRGGGKPDMAQGGGSNAGKIDAALAKADEIVAAQVKQ